MSAEGLGRRAEGAQWEGLDDLRVGLKDVWRGARCWWVARRYPVPDRPASLYEGLGGQVCLLADLCGGGDALGLARCPGYELPSAGAPARAVVGS